LKFQIKNYLKLLFLIKNVEPVFIFFIIFIKVNI
jgi:hypothetical protein